jgi:hypothetical protein
LNENRGIVFHIQKKVAVGKLRVRGRGDKADDEKIWKDNKQEETEFKSVFRTSFSICDVRSCSFLFNVVIAVAASLVLAGISQWRNA